jgi:hypothetical protein
LQELRDFRAAKTYLRQQVLKFIYFCHRFYIRVLSQNKYFMATPNLPSEQEIIEQIRQQLETDERMKKWFDQYRNRERNSFIKSYASTRHIALMFSNGFVNEHMPENKEFNALARKALEHIQQKKLFNLQCEWRAGKLELPFVKIAYDFEIFGREHVMECPFLPPVTMKEVELFCEFLNSSNADDYELESEQLNWQGYDEFRDEFDEDEFCYLPEWYEFYDGKCGTAFLMDLPDIKGEKEEIYRAAFRKHNNPNLSEYVPDPELNKPSLFDIEAQLDFAKRFEPNDSMPIVVAHIKSRGFFDDFDGLDMDYSYLKTISVPLAFVPHTDWKESLRRTVSRYRNSRIAAALPRIWRQYHKLIDNDHEAQVMRQLAKATTDLDKMDNYRLRAQLMESVLEGRKLLGEPADFDY